MNAKQLISALEKLHPDFQDQDLVVIGVNEKDEFTYDLITSAGIAFKGDYSFAIVTTESATHLFAKNGNAVNTKTNKILSEDDLKRTDEDET